MHDNIFPLRCCFPPLSSFLAVFLALPQNACALRIVLSELEDEEECMLDYDDDEE